MKKALSFILMLIMSLSLAACGSSAPASKSAPASAPAASSASVPAPAPKPEYPKAPIQVIIPSAAGGSTDVAFRLFSKYAQKEIGQTFVPVNVATAGGLGAKQAKEAKPDGYTVLYYNNTFMLNKVTGVTDFGIDGFVSGPNVYEDYTNGFVVSTKSPYKNINDLIAAAKANPGKIVYGTEAGGYTHLLGLGFEKAAGIKLNIVDVGGSAQRTAATLNGTIDFGCQMYSGVKSYVDSGQFKFIGTPVEKRSEVAPDIPTIKEQGVDFVFSTTFMGFFFPKGTPQYVLDAFDKATKAVNANPEFQKEAKALYLQPAYKSSADNHKELTKLQEYYDSLKELLPKK